jgi:hypothetical protein
MGNLFEEIDETLRRWIEAQPMWFIATAALAADGRVNVSPRGSDSFSGLGPHRVGWVDFTGSGVETITHLRENGRICVMFASFNQRPRIVRLHGQGQVPVRREKGPGRDGRLPGTEKREQHRRPTRPLTWQTAPACHPGASL